MAGLDPAIHVLLPLIQRKKKDVDALDRSGHDCVVAGLPLCKVT
jgi:hypothetical protein